MNDKRRLWSLACGLSLSVHAALVASLSFVPGAKLPATAMPMDLVGLEMTPEPERTDSSPSPPGPLDPSTAAMASPLIGIQEPVIPVLSATSPIVIQIGGANSNSASGNPGNFAGQATKGLRGHAPGAFFDVSPRGKRIVFVVDASSSMGKNGALRIAGMELVGALAELPASAKFQVFVYSNHARPLVPRLAGWSLPTEEVIEQVKIALESLPAEGSTDHSQALKAAFSQGADEVFFLTDADDLKQEDLRQATLLNRGKAIVNTVELTLAHQGRAGMPMQVLAQQSGGSYRAIDPTSWR